MIKARRGDIEGTVTFHETGPQWGAFHPGGDEAISIPLKKRDALVTWEDECEVCRLPVWIGRGTLEAIGAYHVACFFG